MISDRKSLIDSLPPLREVIDDHDLRAQKSLGQNFLLDMNITDKIVREAADRDSDPWDGVHAVEIGPGPGGLTRALLKSAVTDVTAIEFDARAVRALQGVQDAVPDAFSVVQADALKVDLTDVVDAPRVIVANLPYNIATPLLVGWLKQIKGDVSSYQSMALMFQKEVAERVVARPGTKAYGRLAVISQWLCDVHIMYDLPPNAFTPPPKVKSAVVFFKPKTGQQGGPSFESVEQVTSAAFHQRRKMIRSSLKAYLSALEQLGIDVQMRAENLTVEQYLDIARFSEDL